MKIMTYDIKLNYMEEQVTLLDAGKDTEGQDATGDLTHT
jgi:hypothetical protein